MLVLIYAYVRETFSWTYCVPFVKELKKIIVQKKSAMVEKIN